MTLTHVESVKDRRGLFFGISTGENGAIDVIVLQSVVEMGAEGCAIRVQVNEVSSFCEGEWC